MSVAEGVIDLVHPAAIRLESGRARRRRPSIPPGYRLAFPRRDRRCRPSSTSCAANAACRRRDSRFRRDGEPSPRPRARRSARRPVAVLHPSCPPRPTTLAGQTERRAEQIAQRLRGPILGDELLDVQIDRRRLDALAILRRRDHAFGETPPSSRLGIARSGGPRPDVRSPAAGAREDRTPAAFPPRSPNSAREANGNARRRTPRAEPRHRVWRLAATCRPCGPPARRSPCPNGRAGFGPGAASSSTRRSKAA